jgi:hypothetical protein
MIMVICLDQGWVSGEPNRSILVMCWPVSHTFQAAASTLCILFWIGQAGCFWFAWPGARCKGETRIQSRRRYSPSPHLFNLYYWGWEISLSRQKHDLALSCKTKSLENLRKRALRDIFWRCPHLEMVYGYLIDPPDRQMLLLPWPVPKADMRSAAPLLRLWILIRWPDNSGFKVYWFHFGKFIPYGLRIIFLSHLASEA